uniref:zonular occludens toxin domain-containing protein n=1 Tax=Psychrobacter sp. TaxID=56811 RepID=UPI001599BA75|nr:zonular occludens toxin domain-containing protein [Psychrobacter sp.]QJS05424.1 zonular occludens toxin, putative phage-related protein [Psychrobacter sp.]
MIRVVEATPGAGKTNIVVEWLCEQVDKGFYDEIYTSINGLRIVGVRSIPADFDWRTLNPINEMTGLRDDKKRLVVYDEAQYEKAFMKENRATNEVGKDLSTHRHYGMDIWLITQSSTLLNSYVHANTGEHVFMYRPRKKKTVKIYWWSHIQKSLTKDAFKTADDEQTWRLNPSMFPLYTSTSGVTDGEARKSTKLYSVLLTALMVFGLIGFMIYKGVGSFQTMASGDIGGTGNDVLTVSPDKIGAKLGNEVVQDEQPVTNDSSVSTIPNNNNDLSRDTAPTSTIFNPVTGGYYASGDVAVSGAVMVDGECWAYNVKAQRVLLSNAECSKYLASFGNMAKGVNPSQAAPVRAQPVKAVSASPVASAPPVPVPAVALPVL